MATNTYDAQASTNYKEAFALFDKRGNGRVALGSLGDLLRACGQNPTLAEIRDLEKGVGSDCSYSLPFTLFPIAIITLVKSSLEFVMLTPRS
jgi:Ca2+-binding EF-hand superfamily protein